MMASTITFFLELHENVLFEANGKTIQKSVFEFEKHFFEFLVFQIANNSISSFKKQSQMPPRSGDGNHVLKYEIRWHTTYWLISITNLLTGRNLKQ